MQEQINNHDELAKEQGENLIIVSEEAWEVKNIEKYITPKGKSDKKSASNTGKCPAGLIYEYGPLLSTQWGQYKGYNGWYSGCWQAGEHSFCYKANMVTNIRL